MNPAAPNLQQAVMGALAANQGAPQTVAPDANLQNMYNVRFQSPFAQAAATALGNTDQQGLNRQENEIKSNIQKLEDKNDPSKFQVKPKDDGGYAFYDPDGNEIPAYQYAHLTGQKLSNVLSPSQNPIDQQFIQDYSNLEEYVNAWYSKDKAKLEQYWKDNPKLKGMNPKQTMQLFTQAYPTVYGGNKRGQAQGSTLIPAGQSAAGGMTDIAALIESAGS
jgi:hypothetical protein